jgi:hypothetical protein
MTQENSIIPAGAVDKSISRFSEEEFGAVNTSSAFLPRLQLMGSSSAPCKEGKMQVGVWALVSGQNMTDIGKSLTVAVIAWRPKALDMRDREKIVSCFDVKHPKFAEIKNVADNAPQGTLSGCMYGPEFLIWLPEQKTFATYMASNASAQQEAPNIKKLMEKLATFNITFVPSKKFGGWHAPKVQPCSTPLSEPINPEQLKKEYEKFVNPPALETEVPEEEAKAAGSDRAR